MQKINGKNTGLAIFLVATAIVLIGGSVIMMTTTQTAEAARDCDPNPDGGFTCSGGQGGRVVCDAIVDPTCGSTGTCDGGLICSGGGGGRTECDASGTNCVFTGGTGQRKERIDGSSDEMTVGGRGFHDGVGGSGVHDQGPGGNSGK